jgi:hypothetical protein
MSPSKSTGGSYGVSEALNASFNSAKSAQKMDQDRKRKVRGSATDGSRPQKKGKVVPCALISKSDEGVGIKLVHGERDNKGATHKGAGYSAANPADGAEKVMRITPSVLYMLLHITFLELSILPGERREMSMAQ